VLQETPYAKAVWAVGSLFCLAVVIVESLSGSYLGVAIGVAAAVATVSILLLDRYYLRRKRAFRFGALGTTIVSAVIWLIVFWVSFFFLYFPYSIWPARS
jgi:hypothetical protein